MKSTNYGKKENALDSIRIIPEMIKAGEIKNIYLLYGEERYLVYQQRDRLIDFLVEPGDTMNLNKFIGNGININDVLQMADTLPFFADRRVILVEGSDIFKKSNEELREYLENVPESTVFVFVENEVDARTALYKTVTKNGVAVKLSRQTDETLAIWIKGKIGKEGKKVQQSVILYFLKRVGDDMVRIENELEKLLTYAIDRDEITVDDVNAVTKDALEDRIFDMIEAVSRKDKKNAMALYHDLVALKESPVKILSLISTEYNRLLMIKDLYERGTRGNDIATAMDIKPFLVTKRMGIIGNFSKDDLAKCVSLAAEAEQGFKSGKLTDRLAVEILIFTLLEQ